MSVGLRILPTRFYKLIIVGRGRSRGCQLLEGTGHVTTTTRANGPPRIYVDAVGNEMYRTICHRDLNSTGMVARWCDCAIRFATAEPVGVVAEDSP